MSPLSLQSSLEFSVKNKNNAVSLVVWIEGHKPEEDVVAKHASEVV